MSLGNDNLGPWMQNRFGERYLPSINRETFSQVGSKVFYQRHYGKALWREDYLYLIVGSDGGLLIQYIIDHGLPEGTRYLFIELEPVYQRLIKEGVTENLPDNLRLCALENWQKEAKDFSIQDYFYLGHVVTEKSLATLDASLPDYLLAWNLFFEQYVQLHRVTEHELGSLAFMQEGLRNLAENRTPSTQLRDAFKGKTAVLLAGGPSLSDAFDWVKKHREEVVVIAVSRISRHLIEENIQPDFLATIDPYDTSFHVSRNALELWKDAVFLNMYHASSKLMGQWRGRNVYWGFRFPWASDLNPDNFIFTGATVSHQAFGMAIKMGFEKIFLAGFDLCFSREGFTHVKGSVEHEMGPDMDPTNILVETYGGWKAETWPVLYQSIESMKLLVKSAEEVDCEVINPALGAAKIEGIKHIPWSDVSFTPLDKPAKTIIEKVLPKEDAKSRTTYYRDALKVLDKARKSIQEIRQLASKGLEYNSRLFGRKGQSADFRFKKKMDDIEAKLDHEYKSFSPLVKRWDVRAFLKLSRPDKNREWSDEEIEETGKRYYEIYRDNAQEVVRFLDESRQRLRMRIEEEKPRPNFNQLFKQWEKDHQPGRARIVLDKLKKEPNDFPPRIESRLLQFEQQFEEMLQEQEHGFRRDVAEKSNIFTVRTKAMQLYRNKDQNRLDFMAKGLENSAIGERDQCLSFVRGLFYDLKEDFSSAIQAYEEITLDLFLMDVYPRLSAIYLKQRQMDRAADVMERLAKLMPIHLPHYAELLRLMGKKDLAELTFKSYLDLAKEDIVVQIRLGNLYMEMGRLNEAEALFEKLLKEEPENPAVQAFLADIRQKQMASSV
ncbi:6-hydroxymethylpterin diphosphokinase MptE-like protein [Magnetococcales bacterium HHB-1]